VGGHHTNGAPGLDFLDKLSQATGNAQAPDRESVRHACLWKATIMLFSRYKVAYEKKRKIMRNVASVAEPTKSFFAEINKVEPREGLEKLREIFGSREGDSHSSFAFARTDSGILLVRLAHQISDGILWFA
jgi:hypothetical protein